MKKTTMLFSLLLIIILFGNMASAEIFIDQNVGISHSESENSITESMFIRLDDTRELASEYDIIRFIDQKVGSIPITLYYGIQELPFDLGNGGTIDNCNLTITHYKKRYDGEGNLLNKTTDIYNYSYKNTSATDERIDLDLRERDWVVAHAKCDYSGISTANLTGAYQNFLGIRGKVYTPSYECEDCKKYDFQQLHKKLENSEQRLNDEMEIYDAIDKVKWMTFQIWAIFIWIGKLAMILVAVGLLFATGYYVYKFFEDIGDKI